MFMLAVEREYYSIQTPLINETPVDYLDDDNMVKLVVYLINLFENGTPELFKDKADDVPDPKLDILYLKCWDCMFLRHLMVKDPVVRLKGFLMIKARPVCTLPMKNCLENQRLISLKMIMNI